MYIIAHSHSYPLQHQHIAWCILTPCSMVLPLRFVVQEVWLAVQRGVVSSSKRCGYHKTKSCNPSLCSAARQDYPYPLQHGLSLPPAAWPILTLTPCSMVLPPAAWPYPLQIGLTPCSMVYPYPLQIGLYPLQHGPTPCSMALPPAAWSILTPCRLDFTPCSMVLPPADWTLLPAAWSYPLQHGLTPCSMVLPPVAWPILTPCSMVLPPAAWPYLLHRPATSGLLFFCTIRVLL